MREVVGVVVAYNSWSTLSELGNSWPAEYSHVPVIVVDNASSQPVPPGLSLPENFLLHRMPINLGYSAGVNEGARVLDSWDYLLVVNPDVIPGSAALDRMLQYIDHNDKVGAVSVRLIYPDGTAQNSARRFPSIGTLLERQVQRAIGKNPEMVLDYPEDYSGRVDWLMGAMLMVRRSAFGEGFDSRYFMYMEDVDLCRSLASRGWEVHLLDVPQVIHAHARSSTSSLGRASFTHAVSALKYFCKWGVAGGARSR